MVSLDEVRTARLLLRRISETDIPDLCRFNRDELVTATLGGVRTDEWTRERVGLYAAHWREHGFGWWVARDLATGAFVGRGGLRRGKYDSDREEVELGYGLMSEFWGRGVALEMAEASVWAGFEVLGLEELICFTLPTNVRSRRVMEKAGFVYDRDGVWAELPHVFYRLKARDWRLRYAANPRA